MKAKIIESDTASRVYAKMNRIQRFCGYGSLFVRNNMYSHAWRSFLGILPFMPITQLGAPAAQNTPKHPETPGANNESNHSNP